MTDIIERAQDWLNKHDNESKAFVGNYALIWELAAELKVARDRLEKIADELVELRDEVAELYDHMNRAT